MTTTVAASPVEQPLAAARARAVQISPTLAGCGIAVALALWTTRGVWGDGLPAGEDVIAHLVRLDFGVSELVARGRLDGWLPRFYVGYQEFLFNGPGLVWAVGVLRGLTAGVMSNTDGLKVIGVLSFAATPPAVAFLARSVGLGRLAAGIAAVLSLLVSNIFGVGLLGLYLIGLASHQLGAPLFCVALGALLRVVVDARARWILLAAVSLAALAATHLISVMVLAVLYPVLVLGLVSSRSFLAGLRRVALSGLVAAGLAAWWLVPLIAHHDLSGTVATWATPPFGERLDDIVDGRILFRPHVVWIVVAGWAYAVVRVRNRRPFAATLVLAPLAYLVVAHWAASRWPDNDFTRQLANRGLGYAGIIALLPAAALLADGAAWTARRLRPRMPAALPALAAAGALVVAAGLVLSPLGPDDTVAAIAPEPVPALRAAAAELAERVPDGARFATERDYPGEVARTGVLHPEHWLTRLSGRNALTGFNLEASSTPEAALEPEQIGKSPPDVSADALGRLGVTHVVTTNATTADLLAGSPRFRQAWSLFPMTIFELRETPRSIPSALMSANADFQARLTRPEPEHLRIETVSESETDATVAVAWSPKWDVKMDGGRADFGRTADGLIEVRLPAGRHSIDLTYGPDAWDRIGLAVTLLTLGGICLMLLRRRRRVAPRAVQS